MAKGGSLVTTDQAIRTVRDLLERQKPQLEMALPKHVTPDRMVRVALTSLRRTPKLLECEPLSIVKSVMEAAQLGLEPDGVLGHAYLVPYGRECQLITGYKGLVDLCRRSGNISTIDAQVVYEGDTFRFELGDNPRITHVPDLQDPERDEKPITYVYAVAHLRDGGIQRNVMSKVQIDKHRDRYSKAATRDDSAWKTAYEWMAKKTTLRQLVKLLPVSVEVQRIVGREELVESEALPTEAPMVVSSLDDLADRLAGSAEREKVQTEPHEVDP